MARAFSCVLPQDILPAGHRAPIAKALSDPLIEERIFEGVKTGIFGVRGGWLREAPQVCEFGWRGNSRTSFFGRSRCPKERIAVGCLDANPCAPRVGSLSSVMRLLCRVRSRAISQEDAGACEQVDADVVSAFVEPSQVFGFVVSCESEGIEEFAAGFVLVSGITPSIIGAKSAAEGSMGLSIKSLGTLIPARRDSNQGQDISSEGDISVGTRPIAEQSVFAEDAREVADGGTYGGLGALELVCESANWRMVCSSRTSG